MIPSIEELISRKEVLVQRYLLPSSTAGVAHRLRQRRVGLASAAAQYNVHAMGVGFKVVGGKRTIDLCIRFYVTQKLPKSLIAPLFGLPKTIDGLPTDVIESRPSVFLSKKRANRGALPSASSRTVSATKAALASAGQPLTPAAEIPPSDVATLSRKNRPYFGGVAAANIDVYGGTLGCFCRSTNISDDRNAIYILSNSHVFGGFGDSTTDIPILQQPIGNGGLPENTVANFIRSVPIDFSPNAPNKVEAAIGQVLSASDCQIAIGGIGKLNGFAEAIHNDVVRKCGSSSGLKNGVVTDISHSAIIPLDPGSPASSLSLVDQLYIEPATAGEEIAFPGDSGAIIVNASQQAIGLLCAGDPATGKWAVANKMTHVLTALSISLL